MFQMVTCHRLQERMSYLKMMCCIVDIVINYVANNKKREKGFEPWCRYQQGKQNPQNGHNYDRAERWHDQPALVVRHLMMDAMIQVHQALAE